MRLPPGWRDIDWNWRNFGRGEKTALTVAALGLVILILSGILWNLGLYYLGILMINAFNLFLAANRSRRGIATYGYEPGPGRPISIGTMQAILVGGFVLVAALLGLLIWIGR